MRILILWRQLCLKTRNTIFDHAFSFSKYDSKNEYFYFDMYNGRFPEDYKWITRDMFDAVIFHYSALGLRWGTKGYWYPFLEMMSKIWNNYPCIKILLPQDDYNKTEAIWNLADGIAADDIYTVMKAEDYHILYPKEKIGKCGIHTVLTGYVDEKYTAKYDRHEKRCYDVVYRANKPSFAYGKFAQLKVELVRIFEECLNRENLRINLKNPQGNNGAFLGEEWIKFLASSRVTLGCLSGSGFADVDGHIHDKFDDYQKQNPDASYDIAKRDCFPNLEENLHGVVGPRIFESAMTKTCQVLVGRDYQGILKPDVDYVVLNEDYSNLNDVVQKIKDVQYCEQVAEQCYRDVIESSKYSYAVFVNEVVKGIMKKVGTEKPRDKQISKIIHEYCDKNNKNVHKEMLRKEMGIL